MHVSNLTSPRSGSPVANQYEIEDKGVVFFQSYQTMIAKKVGSTYVISENWNYSRTTAKYFYAWLREYGVSDIEIDIIKKWLRKSSTKFGDELLQIAGSYINVKYVEVV